MFAATLPRARLRVPHRCAYSTAAAPTRAPSPAAFKFHLATAFHGKPTEADDERRPNRLTKKKRLLQGFPDDSPIAIWRDSLLKSTKQPWGAGHDWYFAAQTHGNTVLGIADGVGGWEDSGVDPSHFSQAFMYYCDAFVREAKALPLPVSIMEAGYRGVTHEDGVLAGKSCDWIESRVLIPPGSSTACIITLDASDGVLNAANLGDSTFIVVRDSKVIHAQPSQTHYFNAPRQLSKLPPGSRSDGSFHDLPKHSDLARLELQHDDILILTTDGFSDNVFHAELEQLIVLLLDDARAKGIQGDHQAVISTIAQACCNFARICAFKPDKESPFEVEARQHGLEFKGGKVDDVCVLAVLIQRV